MGGLQPVRGGSGAPAARTATWADQAGSQAYWFWDLGKADSQLLVSNRKLC